MVDAKKLDPNPDFKGKLNPVAVEAQEVVHHKKPYETLMIILLFSLLAVVAFATGAGLTYAMFQGHLDGLTPAVKAMLRGIHLP